MHIGLPNHMTRRAARLSAKIGRAYRRFRDARDGVSAVEFAFLAPVLLTMWIGTAEVGKAVSISWKSKLVARTLADLTGRATTITNQGMTNIFDAAAAVFAPYDVSKVSMRISSIKHVSATQDQVVWSSVRSSTYVPMTARTVGSTVALPTGTLTNIGDTVIYAETFYRYVPVTNWSGGASANDNDGLFKLVGGAFPINYTYFMVPRLTEVARTQ